MTRQDFEMIAETIRANAAELDAALGAEKGDIAFGITANAFADALAQTNPRFDRARFLRACGVA